VATIKQLVIGPICSLINKVEQSSLSWKQSLTEQVTRTKSLKDELQQNDNG
jgi:hypothetical protein